MRSSFARNFFIVATAAISFVTAGAIPAFAGEEDGFGVTSLDARCITDANTISYKASGVDYEWNEHIDITYAVYKDGNYYGNGSPTNLYVSGSGSWSAPTAYIVNPNGRWDITVYVYDHDVHNQVGQASDSCQM
ncbi:hypothetical protein GCM10027258_94900 [Amycolatopsis stemonae]